jgi:NAD+ synthase (glutamine-hydrolysing)
MAWDGQALIYEKGELLAESERFLDESHIIYGRRRPRAPVAERMRTTTFAQSVRRHARGGAALPTWRFALALPPRRPLPWSAPSTASPTCRPTARARRALHRGLQHPGAGAGAAAVSQRHPQGRDRRLGRARFDPCAAGLRQGDGPLGLPRTNILAYTMPGFATSERARCARRAADGRGRLHRPGNRHPPELPADAEGPRPSVCRGREQYDVTFENVQAGERTSHLFRLANHMARS